MTHALRREARPDVLVAVYAASVITAEAVTVFISVSMGVALHALIILATLWRHALRESDIPLPILGIPSLVRILSLTMPLPEVAPETWYVLVGAPLLAACTLAIWAAHWTWPSVGLRAAFGRLDLLAAAAGLPLGWAAATAFGTASTPLDGVTEPWTAAVLALVFVAFPEELLFRGMIQRIFVAQVGSIGIALGAVVFSAMYIPSLSAELVVIMAVAGLVFGWTTATTGNLGGAVAGHLILVMSVWLFTRLGIG